jgi:4'-phosphopantetheinyl transferase
MEYPTKHLSRNNNSKQNDAKVTYHFNKNEIHTWVIDIKEHKTENQRLQRLLSSDEMIRSQRFHFDNDREMYVIAHGALREILSYYLNCLPQNIQLSYAEKNKPYIAHGNLQFNLSHSHQLAVVVVGLTHAVGVDIEHIGKENLDELQIAKRFFAEEEYQQLFSLPREQQHRAFLETWTRKEAFIKSIGDGLSFPLNEVIVNVPPLPAIAKLPRQNCMNHNIWHLETLHVPESYVGTVAIKNCNPAIVYHTY